MKFRPAAILTVAFISALAMTPIMAFADQQDVVDEMHDISKHNLQVQQKLFEDLGTSLKDNFNDLKAANSAYYNEEDEKEKETSEIFQLIPAMSAVPAAMVNDDANLKRLMNIRYRELNRIPFDNASTSGSDYLKTEYYVDTGTPGLADINAQSYDIFMRYFCDPQGRNGTMKDFKLAKSNVDYNGKKVSYNLGCGETDYSGLSTRHSLLGTDDTTLQAHQIIGLPLRPADLFFNPGTFPTTSSGADGETNVNKMAEVYYGAFSQSLIFLLGHGPDDGNNMTGQAEIARKMLASYPFAILFSERTGSMGPAAAQSVAQLLQSKLSAGTQDPVIMQHLNNLKYQNNISLAEYMDIVMYQLPTSPGYYKRISTEMNPAQLRREEVWLTAMQTALNYQRNRWLEILAALEAVR